MTAVISTTLDDQYLFYLPITTWAWNKLGVDVICFAPQNGYFSVKHEFVYNTLQFHKIRCNTHLFTCPEDKEATYAQCSRLYGAALSEVADDEVLITGDIDMAVFNKDYFSQFVDGRIHIVGADLVPDAQYPMCYIAMPVIKWRETMLMLGVDLPPNQFQAKLDGLLGHIECEHFRGNMWAKDQETAYNHICWHELVKHNRAKPGTQFATRRADRDGWPEVISPDIIDAHLPRPGYTPENFAKILNLFQTIFPNDNFDWMVEYRNEYIKLL